MSIGPDSMCYNQSATENQSAIEPRRTDVQEDISDKFCDIGNVGGVGRFAVADSFRVWWTTI